MGLKVPPAEVKRWRDAGVIPAACQPKRRGPPADHLRQHDEAPPAWRVALALPGLKPVSRSNACEHWSTRHARDKPERGEPSVTITIR